MNLQINDSQVVLRVLKFCINFIKGILLAFRKLLATESSLEMMKNAFYSTLKALFVLKIFKFLYSIFGHVEKWLDKKDKVNFKTCDITTLETNNYNNTLVSISRIKGCQKMESKLAHSLRRRVSNLAIIGAISITSWITGIKL